MHCCEKLNFFIAFMQMSFFSFFTCLLVSQISKVSNPFITLYTVIRYYHSLLCSNVVRPSICSLSLYDSSLKFGGNFVAVLCILSSFLMFLLLGDHTVAAYSNLGCTKVIINFLVIYIYIYIYIFFFFFFFFFFF